MVDTRRRVELFEFESNQLRTLSECPSHRHLQYIVPLHSSTRPLQTNQSCTSFPLLTSRIRLANGIVFLRVVHPHQLLWISNLLLLLTLIYHRNPYLMNNLSRLRLVSLSRDQRAYLGFPRPYLLNARNLSRPLILPCAHSNARSLGLFLSLNPLRSHRTHPPNCRPPTFARFYRAACSAQVARQLRPAGSPLTNSTRG